MPCSLITNHGEHPDSSRTTILEETETLTVSTTPNQNECLIQSSVPEENILTCTAVHDGSLKVWSVSHSFSAQTRNQNSAPLESSQSSTRVRKQKRPYSPIPSEKKSAVRKSSLMNANHTAENNEVFQPKHKPFVCEKCSSPYVVNPARSRSSAKVYAPRKAFDPETKKILVVCNACRLSLARSRKTKIVRKNPLPSEETKNKFVEECAKFSATLVEQLKDPDAGRLYCPVFTLRPCKCLQKYFLEPDEEEEQSLRAINMLKILKKAKHLSAQKNSLSQIQNPRPRGLLKQKSQVFEDFVQEMRGFLRTQLKLCERACQRVLMYSNNFLHKQLKSAPDRCARIQRIGGCSRQQLCPIAKLPNETCCQERCVTMALTHSRLLEDWRAAARRSQRDARRVLAEMLTPSGGAKANCYKFIKMVTGCSHTTISLVNNQMWRTQGNREPPEHGLRRWWRQQGGQRNGEGPETTSGSVSADGDDFDVEYDAEEEQEVEGRKQDTVLQDEVASSPSIADIHIPTARELRELAPAEAGRRLLQQRRKLASVQRQLTRQQRQIETLRHERPPIILGCCSGTDVQPVQQPAVVQQSTALQAVTHQPQVVHILEIPTTPSAPSMSDSGQQQPTLSVLSSSGEFEPISNISVNMTPGQPLSTVFFLPEYEAVSTIPTETIAAGNNLVVNASATETDVLQLQHSPNLQNSTTVPAVNPTTASAPASLQHQPPAAHQPQPLHYSSMQFHLPLDIPVQLALQPSGTEHVPTSQHPPLILSSSQPVSYSINQPDPSVNTATQVSLQTTPTAVVNVINKDNQYVQTSEPPRLYYLDTVNCVSSVPD